MGEIRDMKSFNKSNFEPEINNFLFDPNESLIGSQNEEIRVLIIKNIKIKISLIKVILVILIIHEKTKFPRRTIHQT